MDTKTPYILAISIVAIYTGMYVMSKAAFNEGMNSFVFVFYRQAAASLLLATTKTAFCPGSIWPFVPVLEPGFGRRDKSAGGFCPGW